MGNKPSKNLYRIFMDHSRLYSYKRVGVFGNIGMGKSTMLALLTGDYVTDLTL